jgi:hypothetical protein
VTWKGVHWLTGVSQGTPEAVREIVCRHMFGLVFEDRDNGIWTYQRKAVEAVSKAFVAWTPDRLDVAVNLPGEACEMLGTEGLRLLVAELGLKVTRLDVAWDTDTMTPELVRNEYHAGNAATHAKKWRWDESPEGATFYIGKRGSANNSRLVRVYDRRGPTRVELELHEKRADMLWQRLAEIELRDWSKVAMSYLVDFVDFRDVGADANVKRCPRLDWWADFTAGAARLSMPLPRKAPTLDSTREWIEGSMAPTLALIADAVPDATKWLHTMLDDGRSRRKARHTAMLNLTGVLQLGGAVSFPVA